MKRIVRVWLALVLGLAVVLAGCGLAPAKYDGIEQHGYAELWQKAKRLEGACGDAAPVMEIFLTMIESADLLGAYLRYQPDEGSREMIGALQHLLTRFNPGGGIVYCRESAVNLQDAVVRAMQTLGRRER